MKDRNSIDITNLVVLWLIYSACVLGVKLFDLMSISWLTVFMLIIVPVVIVFLVFLGFIVNFIGHLPH